jgi:hypothetical protein
VATATSTRPAKAPLTMKRKVGYALAAIAALVMLWVAMNFADIKAQSKLAASYGAHIACSCRYIDDRPLDACYKDFEPGMEVVSLTDDPANKRVSASVPLLAHAVAERRGDFGCLQLNEKEIEALD